MYQDRDQDHALSSGSRLRAAIIELRTLGHRLQFGARRAAVAIRRYPLPSAMLALAVGYGIGRVSRRLS